MVLILSRSRFTVFVENADFADAGSTTEQRDSNSVAATSGATVPFAYASVITPPPVSAAAPAASVAAAADPPRDEDAEAPVSTLNTPPDLVCPPDMAMPHTQRQFDVLERTACFLAQQDAQMEILLRAKQANNPWMLFLNLGHRLHPLYLHIKALAKAGKYAPPQQRNSAGSGSGPEAGSGAAGAGASSAASASATPTEPKPALASLVGYGSDEEDDEEDDENEEKKETGPKRPASGGTEANAQAPAEPAAAEKEEPPQKKTNDEAEETTAESAPALDNAVASTVVAPSAPAPLVLSATSATSLSAGFAPALQPFIVPPPDIKAIVDKTAAYVARNPKVCDE